ncbi:hypothetical protein [Kiloniella antarctica]|uniref:Mu-like prophage FluMu N-terminal domain-containing protein n=1 Tax=Kiloniella antarctica TaxID=1550907 RepID=A0ABW5BM37_9PROT
MTQKQPAADKGATQKQPAADNLVEAFVCSTLGNAKTTAAVKRVFYSNGEKCAAPSEKIKLSEEEFIQLEGLGQVTDRAPKEPKSE